MKLLFFNALSECTHKYELVDSREIAAVRWGFILRGMTNMHEQAL